MLWLLFAVIVAGNTAVLAGLLLGKRRKSRMDFFIKQLALAGIYCPPGLLLSATLVGAPLAVLESSKKSMPPTGSSVPSRTNFLPGKEQIPRRRYATPVSYILILVQP